MVGFRKPRNFKGADRRRKGLKNETAKSGTMAFDNKNFTADALANAFEGNDTAVKLPGGRNEYRWEDCYIKLSVKPDSVNLFGIDEGPCNGIAPKLKTNIFSMKRKKHYYLYIDDMFCGQNFSSELYIDLKKVRPVKTLNDAD